MVRKRRWILILPVAALLGFGLQEIRDDSSGWCAALPLHENPPQHLKTDERAVQSVLDHFDDEFLACMDSGALNVSDDVFERPYIKVVTADVPEEWVLYLEGAAVVFSEGVVVANP